MFNILDFIDSPDIREYNKNTVFTPAEQAVLIAHSNETTVEEKLAAWQELVNNYSDGEFRDDSIDIWLWMKEETSVRQLVIDTIRSWKNALEATLQKENVIYVVRFMREGEQDCKKKFCSNYRMAYQEMICDKEKFLAEHDCYTEYVGAVITRVCMTNGDDYDVYFYDDELRMVSLMRGLIQEDKDIPSLDFECCVHVPTPFKCGDLVKVKRSYGKEKYGVLVADLPCELKYRGFGRMNMITRLDGCDQQNGKLGWWDDVDVLDLRHCDEDELPESMEKLKTISKLRKKGLRRIAILYKYFHNTCLELKNI